MLYTIPAVALFAALIPVFGIGYTVPAIALTTYSLVVLTPFLVVAFDEVDRIHREVDRALRERLDPDVGQGVVALHRNQRTGGQGEESDDHHGAADDGQRAGDVTPLPPRRAPQVRGLAPRSCGPRGQVRRITAAAPEAIEWLTSQGTRWNRNPDGSIVFEMKDAEVPDSWSQLATDIMVSKYFRKAGLHGKKELGETSVRQVVHRLSRTIREAGERFVLL